jgi:hypothetical protein
MNHRRHGMFAGASHGREVVMGNELMDALGALSKREEALKKWLAEHVEETEPQAHLNGNSREQVYWRYGYMIALRDALNLLRGEIISHTHGNADSAN